MTKTNIPSQDGRTPIHAPARVIVLFNSTIDETFPQFNTNIDWKVDFKLNS